MALLLPAVLLASAVVLPAAAEDASLSGAWQVVSNIAGNESRMDCSFTQKESDLTGPCRSDRGNVEVKGRVDGKRVTWTYKTEYQGNPLTVTYKGTLDSATKMTGTVSVVEFGVEGDFTATQSAGQAAAAPAPDPAAAKQPAQPRGNNDEGQVGSYVLPDPLLGADGKRVKDANTWYKKRRPEILKLAEDNQFGRTPGRPKDMTFEVFDKGTPAFNGKAIRKQITIYFSANKTGPKEDLLLYLPAGAGKPVPVLLNISFSPNLLTVSDPGVRAGEMWSKEKTKVPVVAGRPGIGRLNVEHILDRGFGVATMYYGDIDPDFPGGTALGVRSLYLKPGQTEPAPDEWGAISAWAWGMSRAMDYLETDSSVDAKRVAIFGISRLGKTVVWAGAHDTRFAMVIASCSGEGGAALSRRNYGETVKDLNTRFPYQFSTNYQKYGDRVNDLPIDAHMLLALIAPRPVLLQTGDGDRWSDPKGEFLAAVAAEPVYQLLGKQGLGSDQWPPAGTPVLHDMGYFMHAGGHGALPADWNVFLDFMQMHLQPKK
jgi:hypothetical protein